MNCTVFWSALSAIGTILAAFVGAVGIWINIWDKTRKLTINFERLPNFKIYVNNCSTRTVIITKLRCAVKEHIFYVEIFDGLNELILYPATTKVIDLNKNGIYASYYQHQMDALCSSSEEVEITIFDNFEREYKIKTELPITAFQSQIHA